MLFSKLRNFKKTCPRSQAPCGNARPHFRPRLEPLEDRTLMSASFIKDINLNGASSNPSNLLNINGTLFLSATDNDTLTGLWKSDGTAAGTTLLQEFAPPNNLEHFANVNGELFFEVFKPTLGDTSTAQLWKSDGTSAGTQLVKDFAGQGVFPQGSFGDGIAFQNRFYFNVIDPTFRNAASLWVSDGTTTQPFDPGAFFDPSSFTLFNGQLYFTAVSPNFLRLWKTDGTDQGTQVALGGDFGPLLAADGVLYLGSFGGLPDDLLKFDGTHTTILQSGLSAFGEIVEASGKIFFTAATTAEFFPPRLWVYDGTTTRELNPANVSPAGLFPTSLHAVNGHVVFNGSSIDNPYFQSGIWTSDGTDAGTVEITPSGLASPIVPLLDTAVSGNTLYFADANQLWKTDGTAAGTSLVTSFDTPFDEHGLREGPANLTFVGSTLFFAVNDSAHGQELWELTDAGTMLVKDINTDTVGSFPSQLVDDNGTLFFTANSGPQPVSYIPGPELWKSDGTRDGTQLVGTPFSSGSPVSLVDANGTVFFVGPSIPDVQLWSVRPGAAPQLVKDFNQPNDVFIGGFDLIAVGNRVFFTIYDSNLNETDLWESDGTALGTTMVAENVLIYSLTEAPSEVVAGNELFFTVFDPNTFNFSLWESDGTNAGTHIVDPSNPGSFVSYLTNVNGTLYYFDGTFDPTTGFFDLQLWKTDGTTATEIADMGTDFFPILPPINVGGTLSFFVIDFNTGNDELWTSNGTAAGTVPVAAVPQPDFTFNSRGQIVDAAVLNGRLIFAANDPVQGQQLWVSDGTAQGTHAVTDLTPGQDTFGNPFGNSLFNFTTFADRVFFTATDPIHGQELWETDGTADGTFMVQDINPGPVSSMETILGPQFVPSGGALFFGADDGTHGTELWAYYPATHFQVTTTASIATPGSSFTVTVSALDRNNNVDTGYIGTMHFTSTDGSAILPADYKFTQSDHGVHSFTVTLNTPGMQTIAATDTDIGSIGGLVTLNVPTNVSNRVRPVHTPFFFNPFDGLYDGLIAIQNISGTPINGPIQIVLTGLDPRITLARAWLNGMPLSISHTASGDTVITLNVSQLARRSILGIVVEFSDPFALPINFGIQTYSDSF